MGTGQPGEGTGGFSFSERLDGRILERKNLAEYPAVKDRPAFRHDDLTIIHRDDGKPAEAEYYDSEGHIIHYEISGDSDAVVFLSTYTEGAPQYRLTYSRKSADSLGIVFEISSPDKPHQFVQYIKAGAVRTR